jgi:hypothetical protein
MIKKISIILFLLAIAIIYLYSNKPDKHAYNLLQLDNEISYNLSNKIKVEDSIIRKLTQLKELYQTAEFNDFKVFCDHAQKNCLLENEQEKISYYIFVLEKVKNNFITRTHINKNYIDITWSDMIKDTDEKFINTKYTTDSQLIENMYNTNSTKTNGTIAYYWVDYFTSSAVRKVTLYFKLDPYTTQSGQHIEGGVIGMGYNAENLLNIDNTFYYKKINIEYIFMLAFIVIFIMISFFYFKTSYYKLKIVGIFCIMGLYLITTLRTSESASSVQVELGKIDSINSGIASVSFLAAFNIYILNTMYSKYANSQQLCKETIFITCCTMFLLLISIYKITNYEIIDDIVSIRVSKQFLFNASIILNFFILVNFAIFASTYKFKL